MWTAEAFCGPLLFSLASIFVTFCEVILDDRSLDNCSLARNQCSRSCPSNLPAASKKEYASLAISAFVGSAGCELCLELCLCIFLHHKRLTSYLKYMYLTHTGVHILHPSRTDCNWPRADSF